MMLVSVSEATLIYTFAYHYSNIFHTVFVNVYACVCKIKWSFVSCNWIWKFLQGIDSRWHWSFDRTILHVLEDMILQLIEIAYRVSFYKTKIYQHYEWLFLFLHKKLNEIRIQLWKEKIWTESTLILKIKL